MKKLIYSSLFIASILFAGNSATAQQKVGHVNSNDLINSMPEKSKADSTLQVYGKELQTTLQTMYNEYQQKLTELQSGADKLSETMKEAKVAELEALQKNVEKFDQESNAKFQKKQEEIYAPIIDKVKKAINKVAKDNGYTYVFDSSVGAMLYSTDASDILKLVKTELKIK